MGPDRPGYASVAPLARLDAGMGYADALASAFRSDPAGLVTVIVPPQALTFDGHTLWAGDLAIDVVFRRILVADLRADTHAASALLAAYAARRVCVVSSLRTALLHGKGLFALLHDPTFPLSSTDRAFVRAYIPWTNPPLPHRQPRPRHVLPGPGRRLQPEPRQGRRAIARHRGRGLPEAPA